LAGNQRQRSNKKSGGPSNEGVGKKKKRSGSVGKLEGKTVIKPGGGKKLFCRKQHGHGGKQYGEGKGKGVGESKI